MKDHLLQTVAGARSEERRNLAREYLQAYLLRLIHDAEAFRHLAFVGGTALRVLYALPRFSEDLDFSVLVASETALDAAGLFKRLARDLVGAGYQVAVKAKTERTIANAFFRFERLPYEMGWSRDPRTSLQIKVEIDERPPTGAVTETTLVQRFYPIALRHHDLPTLFAGKLHAILCRPYAKGRDWFDLAWYLTAKRGLEPNIAFLANALAQTQSPVDAASWRTAVRARLHSLRWSEVSTDLAPFLERQGDLEHLQPDLIEKALG